MGEGKPISCRLPNGDKLTLRKALERTWVASGTAGAKRPATTAARAEGSRAPAPARNSERGPATAAPRPEAKRASQEAERFLDDLRRDRISSPHSEDDSLIPAGVLDAADEYEAAVAWVESTPGHTAREPRAEATIEAGQPRQQRCNDKAATDVAGEARRTRQQHGHTTATTDAAPKAGRWSPPGASLANAPRALVLFSGPCVADTHLPGTLAAAGFQTEAVDILIGGESHDLTRDDVAAAYVRDLRKGCYALLALGTPCSSYSVLREPRLRSKEDPTGLSTAPAEWVDSLLLHNQLAAVTAAAIRAAHESGTPWLLENPSDVGDPTMPWFWPDKANHASLFDQPVIKEALQLSGARLRAFAMCAFGTPWRKMTTIAFGGALRDISEPLEQRGCPHGQARHEARLDEHDADGSTLASKASEYPPSLCHELAGYAVAALSAITPREPQHGAPADALAWAGTGDIGAAQEDGAVVNGEFITGGRIAHGRQLHPSLADLVERRRHSAAAFASTRNMEAETAAKLRLDPMPAGLDIPLDPLRKPRKRKKSRPLPRSLPMDTGSGTGRSGAGQTSGDEGRAREVSERPDGPIAIEQLFLPGVYEERVESWFALVDEAGRVMRRRLAGSKEALPRVETRVIEQFEMQPFAQGTIWDCANPRDCVPVERSTADTYIPGAKQIDREGLRRMATELGRGQCDTLDQACGGGIEVRSDCELITVLAFHHSGLLEEFEAAQKAVEHSWQEQWTDAPTRHLPFVPCRLQPRDVVLQDRVRVKKGQFDSRGRPLIESYSKARVTTNSSHGGVDSVNAAIPEAERTVSLPRAQWHARALAIADQACLVRGQKKGVPALEESKPPAMGEPTPFAVTDERRPACEVAEEAAPDEPAPMGARSSPAPEGAPSHRGPGREHNDPFHGRKTLEHALHAIPYDIGRRHQVLGGDGTQREVHAVAYLADAESAYSYCHVQTADHWLQCFVWWDAQGHAGACRERRLPFGGASSPNRFQAISSLVSAFARKMQREFDEQHPLPWPARVWREERAEAQRRGALRQGPDQLEPAYAQVYIDDAGGVALDDPVPTPSLVAGIVISDEPTRAIGGTFAPADSRVLVHAKLLLLAMKMGGLYGAPDKTLVGDPIIALGFHMSRGDWRLRVPAVKRAAMLASIAELGTEARLHATATRHQAKRLIGRLTNVSQVLPELKQFLRGGYRATDAGWAQRAGVRVPDKQQLRPGSLAHAEWIQLLEVADDLLTTNEGIPLAPRMVFPSPREGAILSTTDASGDDGFGGYVFLPGGDPSEVWVVSEPWPPWALEARQMNDRLTADKELADGAELSVPAAELFATWAVPQAVLEACELPSHSRIMPNGQPTADPPIIAIGDCQPAVCVIDAATSGEASMRGVLAEARKLTRFWLGIHVPREANRDADGLSHPANVDAIMEAARHAGFRPRRARVPERLFASLRAAIGRGLTGRKDKRAARPPLVEHG